MTHPLPSHLDPLRRGPGRRPDGVLVRANGQAEAVEVELTPKRDRTEYDRKLAWYMEQLDYRRVHWFVPSSTLRERLVRIAHELRLDDMMRVAAILLAACRSGPPEPHRRVAAAARAQAGRHVGA